MKNIYKILIIFMIGVFGSANVFAAEETDAQLPQPSESSADFSAELPVDDLLLGDLVYINFGLKAEKPIFAFEADIEYDEKYFSFEEISSENMEVSASNSEEDGNVKFAASMLGDGQANENAEVNLILKSKIAGSGEVTLKSAILVYDDLSYTEFNGVDKNITVKVRRASSGTSSSGSGGGGGGGFTASVSHTGGSIAVQATTVPKPEYTAPPEETAPPQNFGESFTDISETEWARGAIEALSAKNIINGIGDGLFNPKGKITRAEFSKIITLACEISTEGVTCDYSDVSDNEWYYPYIAAASQSSLIKGYASGEFRPNGYITREEAAVICARAIGEDNTSEVSAPNFNDKTEISDFAYDSVCLLYTMGIIGGDNEGNFNPRGNLNRAEAAKIIYGLTGGEK